MNLSNRKDLFQHIQDTRQAYLPLWSQLMGYTGRAACYYEGVQWIYMGGSIGSPTMGRLFTSFNPDRTQLRVTANKITRNTVKVAAQTEPTLINVDIKPPDRDLGPQSVMTAQVMESAALALLDHAAFLGPRKVANMRRCIMGDYAIGLGIEYGTRTISMNGKSVDMPDARLKVFTAHPTEFVLDPFQESQDLCDHEYVWWRRPWTYDKIKRHYPDVKLEESECRTVGELVTAQMQLNDLSDGRLFSQYRRHSKTKGAMVWQGHVKDETGGFRQMFIVIDKGGNNMAGTDDMIWVNEDNPVSPFGGYGLPWGMYHSAKRADSMWSVSDVWLQIDDQNRLNLISTLKFRWYQKSAGFKLLIDKQTIRDQGAPESMKNTWTNQVGGLVEWDSRGNRFAHEPKVMMVPLPPTQLAEEELNHINQMQQQLQIADVNFGFAKSHVPDATNQSLIEQAGQAANVRVKEDIETDAKFISTMLGTAIGLARQQSPSILGCLRNAGLDDEDMRLFLESDPNDIGVKVMVRESSIRNRSPEGRRNDLNTALQLQAIPVDQVRMAYAADLDTPITNSDGYMQQMAAKAAMEVLTGAEWQALPLGEYTSFFVQAFRNAMFDKRARRDPGSRQRLEMAIQSQEQASALHALASNPQFLADQATAAQPAQQGQPQEQPAPQTIGEALGLARGSNATQASATAA